MSFDSAFSGDTYTTRVSSGSGPQALLHQLIDGREKCRKCLAGSRGRRDQHVCARRQAPATPRLRSVGASKVRENHAATAGWNELGTLMAIG